MNGMVSYGFTPSMLARGAFFYLQGAGHFHCDRDYHTRREGYGSYLLILTVNGKGYAEYRGRHYELGKGKILIMDCYDLQEYYSDGDDLWEIKWFHFNGSTSREYFDIIYDKFGPVIDMPDNSPLPAFFDGILRLAENGGIQHEIIASKLIVGILTELLLSEPKKDENRQSRMQDSYVKRAVAYIENNYKNAVSLEELAAEAVLSRYHFARIFRKATGYSPYEYVLKYRVNVAKSLLRTTNDTVEQIALGTGFLSASNFIRTFGELEGMTPSKYRKYWA